MILALDIGNTNVVLGCIEDGEILFTERMATDSGKTELDYAISLKMVLELREIKVSEITGAIIGSVVPPVTSLMREAIRKVTGAGSSGCQCGYEYRSGSADGQSILRRYRSDRRRRRGN